MDKKKDLADKLRSSGLRPTKQRLKLAEYLFNRSKTFHFTVENLDKVINKKGSEEKVALATIYNTIHAFKKARHLKEIFKLMINAGVDLFCLGNNLIYDKNYIPKSIEAITKLVENNEVSMERIRDSIKRINTIKLKYGLDV